MFMELSDWLPRPPWEGPPLPKFLNFYWPGFQAPPTVSYLKEESTTVESPRNIFSSPTVTSMNPVVINPPADLTPAYENLEEIELQDIDPDLLMPRKIVIHRKYKMRSK
jgi:hypothetical protein